MRQASVRHSLRIKQMRHPQPHLFHSPERSMVVRGGREANGLLRIPLLPDQYYMRARLRHPHLGKVISYFQCPQQNFARQMKAGACTIIAAEEGSRLRSTPPIYQ
jgi:hypothetical protein